MNKKLLAVLSCSTLLVTLSGCGKAETAVSDEWLVKYKDEEITKNDVYEQLVNQGNITPVKNEIDKILANKAIKTDDEIKKAAEEQLKMVKESSGDQFNEILKAQGFKDEKAFMNEIIIPSVKMQKLPEQYIKEQYKEVADKYGLYKLQVIAVDDAQKVKELKKDLKAGKLNFDELAKKYNNNEIISNSKATIYSEENGDIPEAVWKKVKDTEKGKTTGLVNTKVNKTYMVVKVCEKNPEKFKKDGQKYLLDLQAQQDQIAQSTAQQAMPENGSAADTQGEISKDSFKYFLEKYDFSAHDYKVYESLTESSSKYDIKD